MTKLYFLRACPVWTTYIPAATVEELPDWLAKKLIAGGVAIDEGEHQKRIAARKERKEAEAKAKEEGPKPEKKHKKGGKE